MAVSTTNFESARGVDTRQRQGKSVLTFIELLSNILRKLQKVIVARWHIDSWQTTSSIPMKTTFRNWASAVAVAMTLLGSQGMTLAADHGDAPNSSNDQASDLGDTYLFLDPNDNTKVVMIMTFRGFIASGENANFGIFDPNVLYKFDIDNNRGPAPERTISVTFSPRVAIPGPEGRAALEIPQPQTASIRITGVPGVLTAPTTNSGLGPVAPPPVITSFNGVTVEGPVDFFAGLVDDPFFFDIPAFSRFIGSVRSGSPDPSQFSRGRDSFAGYNTMAIAIRLPVSFVRNARGDTPLSIRMAASASRRIQYINRRGQSFSIGSAHKVDRSGVPAVNVVLIPFNQKNAYNAGTPLEDSKGAFAPGIIATLTALGTAAPQIDLLASVAVTRGDYLTLTTNVANSGPGGGNSEGAGFPNGRRLQDDVVDTLLTIVSNFTPVGDSVPANDVPFNSVFPFLAAPQQPRAPGTVDDNTRN